MRKFRQYFTLVLTIVFAIILLMSSSYAWFNSNQVIEESGTVVRVSSVDPLKVSSDAREFSRTFTLEDIFNADYIGTRRNSVPNMYHPVSTVGNITDGFLDMYYGSVFNSEGTFYLTAKKITDIDGVTGKYLAFDIYFLNMIEKNVYLDRTSRVFYEGGNEGIENAVRVAFVNEGTIEEDASLSDIQGLNEGKDVKIWEPNANKHTLDSVNNAKLLYNLNISTVMEDRVGYLGVKDNISTPVEITSTDENYFGEPINLISTFNDTTVNDKNVLLYHMEPGITKLRIYAWVEGQDVDCEDMAAGATVAFNFKFTTVEND